MNLSDLQNFFAHKQALPMLAYTAKTIKVLAIVL